MHERHAFRLVRDLFAHKEAIFGELKRASALTHTTSGAKAATQESRLRGISTDESHRREAMEARNKAIANRSRAPSPAPHANGRAGGSHRRDRSTGPVEGTRFPIHPSSSPTNERKPINRTSLDVPGSSLADSSPTPTNISSFQSNQSISASNNASSASDYHLDPEHPSQQASEHSESTNGAAGVPEKKDSLSRSSRFPARKHVHTGSLSRTAAGPVPGDRSNLASLDNGPEKVGVQLTDAPMDD